MSQRVYGAVDTGTPPGTALGTNGATLIGGSTSTAAPTQVDGTINPLSLDTTGAVRVNVTAGGGSNASIGVDGATAPTSSTQVGGQYSGNLTPITLDGSGNLNVNIAAGGSSNPSIGTTGSTTPASAALSGATVSTSAPSLVAGDMEALSLTTSGALRVDASAVTQPVSGTFWQATQPVSGTFYQATQPVSGTFYQATQPVSAAALPLPSGASTETTLASVLSALSSVAVTGPLTDTQLRTTPVPVSGTVTATTGGLTDTQLRATAVPVSGTVTANLGTTGSIVTDANLDEKFGDLGQKNMAGSAPVVIASDQASIPVAATCSGTVAATQSGTWTVQPGNTANTTAWKVDGSAVTQPVSIALPTTGGATISRTLSANNTTTITVKASAGQLYGMVATNTNASARYVKFYNSTTASVGTTTPVLTFVIPGNTVGAGMVLTLPMGAAFGTGIQAGITTGIADNDTGAPAANEVVLNVFYA